MSPVVTRALIAGLVLAGCASEPGTSAPFRDAGPMDAALAFDVVRFDVIRSDRGPMTRPEVLDFTDVDPLPGQLDATPMDRPCATQLPGEYRVYPEGPSLRFDDRITLGPPRRFRFERRVPGSTTPLVCETSIPACGAADAVDVDELSAALLDPEVAMALRAPETVYGCDARRTGGTVLIVERLGNRAVVGDPCRVCMDAQCVPAPLGLQRLTDVLVALRDQELLRPVCRDLTSLDAGPADAGPADVSLSDAPSPDLPPTDRPLGDAPATD